MLQNLDLDTVTFAQIASTGDPITIQDMNEQEMIDLIIVNLARLCVAGEWDGLLSAGGGGGVTLVGGEIDNPDTYKYWAITAQPPLWNHQSECFIEATRQGHILPLGCISIRSSNRNANVHRHSSLRWQLLCCRLFLQC